VEFVGAWRVCHAFWPVQPAATANRGATDRIRPLASLRRLWAVQTEPTRRTPFEAAQQESAESARLFDLSEHRFGQLFAQPVGAGRVRRPLRRTSVLRPAELKTPRGQPHPWPCRQQRPWPGRLPHRHRCCGPQARRPLSQVPSPTPLRCFPCAQWLSAAARHALMLRK
jgi:hypothetical protein